MKNRGGHSFNPTGIDKQDVPGTQFGAGAGRVSVGSRSPMNFINKKMSGAMGPVDPLTMTIESDAYRIDQLIAQAETTEAKMHLLISTMQEVVEALKAGEPVLRLRVQAGQGVTQQSPWIITSTESREFFFTLSGKKVTGEKLFVQNNSAVGIYYNWGEPASPGKGFLAAGATLNMDAQVDNINLMSAGANLNVNGDVAAHIFIAAWGSTGQMYQKGQA